MLNNQTAPEQTKSPLPAKTRAIEKEILQFSGLELGKDLHILDVPIDFDGPNYIHTYRCGDHNKEDLVLVHGYLGCGILYYEMLKGLSQKYRVFCIDLLGMGLSSRPEFKCKTTEESIGYFVESIEKWREALGLERFYLAGHSFGGYMAINYTMKYSDRVKKLFLFSPAGLTKYETEADFAAFKTRMGFFTRQVFNLAQGDWNSRTTLPDRFKKSPFLGKHILRSYVSGQFSKSTREKKLVGLLQDLYMELFSEKGGSDSSVFYLLGPLGSYGFMPLEDLMNRGLQTPTECFFGDRDWMDQGGARRIAAVKGDAFTVKILKDSGHHMSMDNAKDLADYVLNGIVA